jgi:NADH-quinone oxidoreductase subunit L
MEHYPQLVPLMILIPAVGAFINFFWGGHLGEKWSSRIGIVASSLTFIVALLLLTYLTGSHHEAVVVNPPLFDGWIRLGDASVEIPWQMRVDTLSVTMMLFVSFVGTLIHVYSAGYMHGDARFARFFAYLNMFLAFMFILVSGNNFLMMFVGWEGVGLCSFLLIGFWFDKARGVGWRNSTAARKAMIANRIGDFGMLRVSMARARAKPPLKANTAQRCRYSPTTTTSPPSSLACSARRNGCWKKATPSASGRSRSTFRR